MFIQILAYGASLILLEEVEIKCRCPGPARRASLPRGSNLEINMPQLVIQNF